MMCPLNMFMSGLLAEHDMNNRFVVQDNAVVCDVIFSSATSRDDASRKNGFSRWDSVPCVQVAATLPPAIPRRRNSSQQRG